MTIGTAIELYAFLLVAWRPRADAGADDFLVGVAFAARGLAVAAFATDLAVVRRAPAVVFRAGAERPVAAFLSAGR